MSPLISSGTPAGSSGYYLVEFHPDVDPNAARRLILNMRAWSCVKIPTCCASI